MIKGLIGKHFGHPPIPSFIDWKRKPKVLINNWPNSENNEKLTKNWVKTSLFTNMTVVDIALTAWRQVVNFFIGI